MQIIRSAMTGNSQFPDRAADKIHNETFDTVIGNFKFSPGGSCVQPELVIYEMTQAQKFSYCPSCTGLGDACNGGGCQCSDGVCRKDCCKK
jgi:hypothetical protein